MTGNKRLLAGFTLIELLVVLAIIASLVTLVTPRYFHKAEQASETVLKHNLIAMREAIDRFYADIGRYPDTLSELVERRYLREIPFDPVAQSHDEWIPLSREGGKGIYDVKSGARGSGSDGSLYKNW